MSSVFVLDSALLAPYDVVFQYRIGHHTRSQEGNNRLEFVYTYADFIKAFKARLSNEYLQSGTYFQDVRIKRLFERIINQSQFILSRMDNKCSSISDFSGTEELFWDIICDIEVCVTMYPCEGLNNKYLPEGKLRTREIYNLAESSSNPHWTRPFPTQDTTKINLFGTIEISVELDNGQVKYFGVKNYSELGTFLIRNNMYDRQVIKRLSKVLRNFLSEYGKDPSAISDSRSLACYYMRKDKKLKIIVNYDKANGLPLKRADLPFWYAMGLTPYAWLKK